MSKKAMLQPKNPTKYDIKILKIVVKSTFATKKILKMFTKKKQNKNRSEVRKSKDEFCFSPLFS